MSNMTMKKTDMQNIYMYTHICKICGNNTILGVWDSVLRIYMHAHVDKECVTKLTRKCKLH